MHYTKYAVVLAAGSKVSFASAEPESESAALAQILALQIAQSSGFANLVRRKNTVKPATKPTAHANTAQKPDSSSPKHKDTTPNGQTQHSKGALDKTTGGQHKNQLNATPKGQHGTNLNGQSPHSKPGQAKNHLNTTPNGQAGSRSSGLGQSGMSQKTKQQQSSQDPKQAAMMAKADEAAAIAFEYNKKYKELSPPGLRNNQPPPVNFNMGTYYSGPVNDYSQTAYGGGSNARDGASANQNSQVDRSMNDNRLQVASGSTVSGNVNNSRRGPNTPGKARRDIEESDVRVEDGKVVYKDFPLLIQTMKQNPAAKNQVLYELAGVPGLRSIVEGLIQQFTETDGQLTMNNFAALVESMNENNEAKTAVLKAFNSNLIYAFVIEKILTQYTQGSTEPSLERRQDYYEDPGLYIRDLDFLESLLEARDSFDEYYWL